MARVCYYCGKKTRVGNSYTRRGMAKAKGGVGKKVTAKNKRRFKPNLHEMRAVVDGGVKRIKVCSGCLKAGKVTKPVPRDVQLRQQEREGS